MPSKESEPAAAAIGSAMAAAGPFRRSGGVGPCAFIAVPARLFVKALSIDVDADRQLLTPLLSSATGAEPPEDRNPALKRATTHLPWRRTRPGHPDQAGH